MSGGTSVHATGTAKVVGNRIGRFAGAAMLLLAGAASAAQPDDDRNAATWYRRAIERMRAAALTTEERVALGAYELRGATQPSETVRAALARLQSAFSALRRGAEQGASDFGLDYGQGFDLEMPHLAELQGVARLMQRDAMVRLNDGDTSGAADSIASLYRLSGHFGDDRVLISSLVGQAVFRLTDQTTQYAMDLAAFGPGECGGLLTALETIPAGDAFGVVGCLLHESDVVTQWLRDKYADEHARGRISEDLGLQEDDALQLDALLLVENEREAALDAADEVMGRAVEAFLADDPDEGRLALECLQEEVRRGEHGAIAAVLLPSYLKLYERLSENRKLLADRIELLRAVAAGERSPSSLVNAAVWYLRAVEMIQDLDADFRAQLPRIVREMKPIDAETSQRLSSASAIIDTLRQGSQAPRCDFSIAGGKPAAVPGYLPGLRESFRLLQADALRLLHEGERDQGADRLAIGYRVAAHLAGDPQLAGALVAHTGFEGTDAVVRPALGSLEDAQRAVLLAAVQAMPARDPFGYMGAIERARREILKALHVAGPGRVTLERAVQEAGGDALMYFLVVATRRGDEEDLPAAWQPLADVLDLEALRAARSRAEAARALLAESGDVNAIRPDPMPEIGRVRERSARAMQDYRAAVGELEGGGMRRPP